MSRTKANTLRANTYLAVLLLVACAAYDPDERLPEQHLLLDFGDARIAVPLDALDVWLTSKPSRPEHFAIHGDGTVIAGRIPRGLRIGYEEDWHVLLGQAVPVSDRGGDPAYARPSVLTVPGRGQFQVLGGSFTVEKVEPGTHGLTPLTGRIELIVRSARAEKTLHGTFAVKAMTWSASR